VVQVDLRRPTAIKLEADIGRCDDQDWKTLLKIILKYVGPLGNVLYHTVKTDQNGCFENFFVSVTGGTWQVSAEYPGGKCEAPEWKVRSPCAGATSDLLDAIQRAGPQCLFLAEASRSQMDYGTSATF
jgi:hypothetical protein